MKVVPLILLFTLCVLSQNYKPYTCDYTTKNSIYDSLKLTTVDPSNMIGYDDVRKEMEQILLGPIQYPDEYKGLLGGDRGVMIFGPPGTGKTLMIATLGKQLEELGWRVLKVTPTDIKATAWSGEAENRLDCIFETARLKGKVVLLFDEGESLFTDRTQLTGSDTLASNLVSVALNQMNDMKNYRVIVITNLPTQIDSAIRRRVGFQFCMRLPNDIERQDIFCKFFKDDGWKMSTDFNYTAFHNGTTLYAGDDIRRLCSGMARDKVVGVSMPFRENASPFSTKDWENTMKRVKPTTDLDMLKQIAEYAAEHSNPCLTEFLNPTALNKLKRAWLEDDGFTPSELANNLLYKAKSTNVIETSENPEESYFKHMTGGPSRNLCVWNDNSSNTDHTQWYIIAFGGAGGMIVIILIVVAIYMRDKNNKNEIIEPKEGEDEKLLSDLENN